MENGSTGSLVMAYPQFIDPRPAVLLDVRFRKALAYAMDRQEMVETLQGGLTQVAHAYFNTGLPQYRELGPFVVTYEFDPRRASQLIESTGYVRDADGSFRPDSSGRPDLSGRDPPGQPLSIEIRDSGQLEIQAQAKLSIASYWRRLGIGVETVTIGVQRASDREYMATRPGFQIGQNSSGNKELRRAYSSETPLPENNYTKTGNNSRHMNPEFDALLDRYFSTIPIGERFQVLGQVLHYSSDQLTVIPLFYGTQLQLVSNRLVGIGPRTSLEGTEAWNAYGWDVQN